MHNIHEEYAPTIILNGNNSFDRVPVITNLIRINSASYQDNRLYVYSGLTGAQIEVHYNLFDETTTGFPNIADLSYDREDDVLWILKTRSLTRTAQKYNPRTYETIGAGVDLPAIASVSNGYYHIGAYNSSLWEAGYTGNDLVIKRRSGTVGPSTQTFAGVAALAHSDQLLGFEVDQNHFFFLLDPTWARVYKLDTQNNNFTLVRDWYGLGVRTYEKLMDQLANNATDRDGVRKFGSFSAEVLEDGEFGPRIAYLDQYLQVNYRYTYEILTPTTNGLSGEGESNTTGSLQPEQYFSFCLGPHRYPPSTTEQIKVSMMRIEIDYEGPNFSLDDKGELDGISPPSRQMIFEVQGEVPDKVLLHEGSIVFVHNEVEYVVQSFTQDEDGDYLLSCNYKER